MKSLHAAIICATLGWLITTTTVVRADIMTPTGLSPGAQFRIIFVSSDTRDATSSDIADYDKFISDLADAAGLTYNGAAVQWFAIGSTPFVNANASTRLPTTSTAPIYRVDGVLVATSGATLWDGGIDVPINVNESGTGGIAAIVWTGTTSSGSRDGFDHELGGTAFAAITGFSDFTSGAWVEGGLGPPRTAPHRVYGYSEVLTVPGGPVVISEPASVTLVLVGIAGVAGFGWRRRKRAA